MGTRPLKTLGWIGSSYKDLLALPAPVIREFGYALYRAQLGERAAHIKPLKGFGGGSVFEVIEDFDGNTYRAVYTVRYSEVVYVLHVFQKKSRTGRATPASDIILIRKRLAFADQEYRRWRQGAAS